MAFSKIVLTFQNFEAGNPVGETVNFNVDGNAKNEVGVVTRFSPGQFAVSDTLGSATNYKNAWLADFAGTMFTVTQASNVITITATYDGAVFSDYSNNNGRVTAVITNVAFDPPFELTSAVLSAAPTPCTHIRVTLTEDEGASPFEWVTPLAGTAGLVGDLPRTGSLVTITIEDNNADQDSIQVFIPDVFTTAAINDIQVIGDVSGLFGSVAVFMNAIQGLTYEFSMNGADYQVSNAFTGILPGSYTLYVRDNYGCVINQPFDVTLQTLRPPVYRDVPLSNSFGWYEVQSAPNNDTIMYNGRNVQPNLYKPLRFNNPPYYQPWTHSDVVRTQFRSNYDTLTAELLDLDDNLIDTLTIVKKSDNIGNRQILDAKIYDRGSGQTGVYFLTGNEYDADGNIIGSHALNGELPEWVKVGQTFSLAGSIADGIFEVKQIIFDSTLAVFAAVVDRSYVDMSEPVNVVVDAVFNRLNYEVYEFETSFDSVDAGCYKVKLSMTDSLEEYQDSIWYTSPLAVSSNVTDHILFEASLRVDDGVDYSTGIIHLQRLTGLFFPFETAQETVTHDDSKNKTIKLNGTVEKYWAFECTNIPDWVAEKINLFVSKRLIKINGVEVQFKEGLSYVRNAQYSRVHLTGRAKEQNYEQYLTDSFNIL